MISFSVSFDLWIHDDMEPVQSRRRQRSNVFEDLDAFEAVRESAGAFAGATGSFLFVLDELRERAGAAVGAAAVLANGAGPVTGGAG